MAFMKGMLKTGLSGNQLKVIALIAMTIDHIGMQIFSEYRILRIIGRIAFPIFAYMIAEGCKFTKSRKKYLLGVAVSALICQSAYFFALDSLYQCIMVTFFLSILLIFAYDNATKKEDAKSYSILFGAFLAVLFLTEILPRILTGTDYRVDYGFWGVMLPLLVYAGKNKPQKLLYAAAGLLLITADFGGVQWYAFFALPLLMLYSGKRGKIKMKNFFYIYYPSHIILLQLLAMLFGVIEKL